MQTDKQAEKLYSEYEKLIVPTIHRQFPLHREFISAHGLELDDLIQYGRIGLYRACKTYDDSKGASMRSYAIQSIIWMINDELTKDSLNNVDNKSLILLDKNSLDNKFSVENSEDLYLYDVVGEDESGYMDIEVEHLIESIRGAVSDRLVDIIKMKYQGYTYKEIGNTIGVSSQYCEKLLSKNKSQLRDLLFA